MVLPQSCNEIIPLLDAFFDAELSADESEAVQTHLTNCQACSARLATTAQLVNSLKAMPKVAMTRDVTESIPTPSKVLAFPPRAWAAAGIAAAVAIVALAAINGSFTNPPTVATRPDKSQPNTPAVAKQENVIKPNPQSTAQDKTAPQVALKIGDVPSSASVDTHKTSTKGSGNSSAGKSEGSHSRTTAGAQDTAGQQAPVAIADNNIIGDNQDGIEIAIISDEGSLGDALGIATDEDGLYELKM